MAGKLINGKIGGKPRHMAETLKEGLQQETRLQELFSLLDSEILPTRLYAISELKRTNDPSAVPALIGCMDDEEPEVRAGAVYALGSIGDKSAIPILIEALDDVNQVVLNAIDALGEMGAIAAFKPLEELEHDPVEEIRERAVEARDKIRDAPVESLAEAFKSGSHEIRERAIHDLGPEDRHELPVLIEALKAEDMWVRCDAVSGISYINSESTLMAIIEMTNDPEEIVRGVAIRALGEMGSPVAVPRLLEVLENDFFTDNKAEAVRSLGYIGDSAAIPGLVGALGHHMAEVTGAAVDALGGMDEKDVVPEVLKAMEIKGERARENCFSILYNMRHPKAISMLERDIEHEDEGIRLNAVYLLGKFGGESALMPLLHAMNEGDYMTKIKAIEGLGKIGSEAAIVGLVSQIYEESEYVIQALKRIGGKAIPILTGMIGLDSTHHMQHRAIVVLGEFKDRSTVPAIISFLEHAEEDMDRRGAIRALGKIGGPLAIGPLLDALKNEKADNWEAAIDALASPDYVDGLLLAIYDDDKKVRNGAARAVVKAIKKCKRVEEVELIQVQWDMAQERIAAKGSGEVVKEVERLEIRIIKAAEETRVKLDPSIPNPGDDPAIRLIRRVRREQS